MQVDKTYRLKNISEELENEQDLITVYSGNTSRTKVTDEEATHLRSLAKLGMHFSNSTYQETR